MADCAGNSLVIELSLRNLKDYGEIWTNTAHKPNTRAIIPPQQSHTHKAPLVKITTPSRNRRQEEEEKKETKRENKLYLKI